MMHSPAIQAPLSFRSTGRRNWGNPESTSGKSAQSSGRHWATSVLAAPEEQSEIEWNRRHTVSKNKSKCRSPAL